MAESVFYEEGSKLLTAVAFQFVLDRELARALRSQNFLTLVIVEASREWEGMTMTVDDAIMHEMAQLVSRDVRDIDVIGHLQRGTFALALVDADFEHSVHVIERFVARLESYEFPTALRIAVGAACYPSHAVDADSLARQAIARPLVNWRGGVRSSADQN
jgi:GGDEF domain-containing protein